MPATQENQPASIHLFADGSLEAEARGKRIIRDKTEMKSRDRISTFMDRIGKGVVNGRVCGLSDKYLTSPYCMHELFDVWRSCREHPDTFIDGTRVPVLASAKISTAVERAQYVIYWKNAFRAVELLSRSMINSCCPTRTMPNSG